ITQAPQPALPDLQITIATQSQYDVLGSETIQPDQAMLQGLGQVIGQEYPHIGCRQIDLKLDAAALDRAVDSLWSELTRSPQAAVTAYRNGYGWQQTYQSVQLENPDHSAQASPALKSGGTYLILGDLTQGLGSIWAEYLATTLQAKLVLISDLKATPPTSEQIQTWEAAGAVIRSLQVELTAIAALQEAIQTAEQSLGQLAGVFYSTPTTNAQSAAPLTLLTPEHLAYNEYFKVQGLRAIATVLKDKSLDFCCVQSSLSAVLGGIGLAAYAGANCFVDAFVQAQNQPLIDQPPSPPILGGSEIRNSPSIGGFRGPDEPSNPTRKTPWFSVNWDACLEVEDIPTSGLGAAIAPLALTPAEVWDATQRILAAGCPGAIVVSKGNLAARIKQWQRYQPQSIATDPTTNESSQQNGLALPLSAEQHPRPPLMTPYVAPRNVIEQTIATIWQDLLRLETVGVNDSFFDLGGHSLLAIQAISRLRDAFPVAIEMRSLLFESPTIAGIAAVIAEQLPVDTFEAMSELLAEVQALSPDEVEQQIQQAVPTPDVVGQGGTRA
ncbi:MAG: KR domain-containing protein, partial [Cyanobacteria bacterium P01_H01_bin.121]